MGYKNKPSDTWLDEYPYASTAQGGKDKYKENLVSLKPVSEYEQRRQAGILSNFYEEGVVTSGGINDPTSWFLNFAHFGSMSFMIDRNGNKHFFSFKRR